MEATFQVNSASLIHPGRKRRNNEDFAAFFEPANPHDLDISGRLYIVADGVGGASHGEKASQYAAEKVLFEYYQRPDIEPGERLRMAFEAANKEIFYYAETNDLRMATTMVAAVVIQEHLILANVGDSRGYLIRSGRAQQLTEDHNEVQEMVRHGLLTAEEARNIRGKNRISRSLGGEVKVRVDVFGPIKLKTGDRILLCSDGLTRYIDEEILVSLGAEGKPEDVVERYVDYANQQGGVDNISTILVSIGRALGKEAITIALERGHQPKDVDWDTIDWETSASKTPMKFWQKLIEKPKARQLIILALSVAILLVVMIGILLVILDVNITNRESQENLMGTLVAANQTVIATAENPDDLEFQGSYTTTNSIPETSPDLTTTLTAAPGLVTATLSVTETLTPAGLVVNVPVPCEYTVVEGDSIWKITKEKLLIMEEPYQITCAPDDENCAYDENNPEAISPGWRLVFPQVLPDVCLEQGGKLVNNE